MARSDSNRRVNILTEHAEQRLRQGVCLDSVRAESMLDRAGRSLDATVSDLNRAYFHHIRGLAYVVRARAAEREDLLLARSQMEYAFDDLTRSVSLYRAAGRVREVQVVSQVQEEVIVKLGELRGVSADIAAGLSTFRKYHPDPHRSVFVMMRYLKSPEHQAIFSAIQRTLKGFGLNALRADQREYDADLLANVRIYAHGCAFGVAVFENLVDTGYSPNVPLEVGYMMALGKPVCLLKEESLTTLPADLIGRLYVPFGLRKMTKGGVETRLRRWLRANPHVWKPQPRQTKALHR